MTYRALFPFMCVLWLAVDSSGQSRFTIVPFINVGLSKPLREANPNNGLPDEYNYNFFLNPQGVRQYRGISFGAGCNLDFQWTQKVSVFIVLGWQRFNYIGESAFEYNPRLGYGIENAKTLKKVEGDAYGLINSGVRLNIFGFKKIKTWIQMAVKNEFYYRSYLIFRYIAPDRVAEEGGPWIPQVVRPYNISLAPSIGCDIDLNKRISLTTSFGAQQQLRSKYVSDYVITERWQSVWMSVGMRYHLGQGSGEERK